jgi:hypothetical protein
MAAKVLEDSAVSPGMQIYYRADTVEDGYKVAETMPWISLEKVDSMDSHPLLADPARKILTHWIKVIDPATDKIYIFLKSSDEDSDLYDEDGGKVTVEYSDPSLVAWYFLTTPSNPETEYEHVHKGVVSQNDIGVAVETVSTHLGSAGIPTTYYGVKHSHIYDGFLQTNTGISKYDAVKATFFEPPWSTPTSKEYIQGKVEHSHGHVLL